MTRPKGSKNKLVSQYYRSYFDIQQLYDPGTTKRPIQWFERLEDISSRMVYIVTSNDPSKITTNDFGDYLNTLLKPLSKELMLSKSGKRNNDNLKADLDEFYIHIYNFYLTELDDNAGDGKTRREVKGEIRQIKNIITKALEKAKKRIYTDRVFFVATQEEFLKPLKNVPHIAKKIDHETVRKNLSSWKKFWKANILLIEELECDLMNHSAFVRKETESYKGSNTAFSNWIAAGKKYLTCTNSKISPQNQDKYLKQIILNSPARKLKNI